MTKTKEKPALSENPEVKCASDIREWRSSDDAKLNAALKKWEARRPNRKRGFHNRPKSQTTTTNIP